MSAKETPEAERIAIAQKDEAILLLLAKLAIVYWRPDFTPGQARELYTQYLDDLRPFAFADIAEAIEKYRQDAENKFYPLPGQLRGIIEAVPYWSIATKREQVASRLKAGREEMAKMIAVTPAPKQLAAE